MKSKRMAAIVVVVVVALALVGGLFLGGPRYAEAAPAGAPTPVTVYSGNGSGQVANFFAGRIMNVATTPVYSGPQNLAGSEKIDLQWVVAQSTPNPVSIKLQFSNDGVNWIDGPAPIATPNATPQNVMQQYNVFGRYGRASITLSNTNPVTVTVIGLGK